VSADLPLSSLILPFDAIPDALAALGYTGDAIVIVAALRALGSRITSDHQRRAEEWLNTP